MYEIEIGLRETNYDWRQINEIGGEDTLLICQQCGYAANREVAVAAKATGSSVKAPSWELYV